MKKLIICSFFILAIVKISFAEEPSLYDKITSKIKFNNKDSSTQKVSQDKAKGDEVHGLKGIRSSKSTAELQKAKIPYIGNWTKTEFYVDGAPNDFLPTTLVLRKDTFDSHTTRCSASGNIQAQDGAITLVMTGTDCPAGLPLPYSVTYGYTVSDKAKTLTMTTPHSVEIYNRKDN